MVDLLVLIFVCFLDGIRKFVCYLWKTGIIFCKVMCWLVVVPMLDVILLAFTLIAFILCKLLKKKAPKVKHTKKWITYPTWEY